MSLYSLISPLLFRLPTELSHNLSLRAIDTLHCTHLSGLLAKPVPSVPVTLAGLALPNPVGLAAGLDKNGDHIDGLGALGFGFIEIGTITPRPQPGNPQPRLFRLPEQQAIINRMGFNNKGVEHLVRRAGERRWSGVLGINIGKNASTPLETAADDYVHCLNAVFPVADYITVNISSPNTPGLRNLQTAEYFARFLEPICERHAQLSRERAVPLLVKLAPDASDEELQAMASVLLEMEVDGVIATNTTVSRPAVPECWHKEAGGLSGAPLQPLADHALAVLASALEGKVPVVGVGGVTCGADAARKKALGAAAMQIYSGFIYRGPALIGECARAWQGDE